MRGACSAASRVTAELTTRPGATDVLRQCTALLDAGVQACSEHRQQLHTSMSSVPPLHLETSIARWSTAPLQRSFASSASFVSGSGGGSFRTGASLTAPLCSILLRALLQRATLKHSKQKYRTMTQPYQLATIPLVTSGITINSY